MMLEKKIVQQRFCVSLMLEHLLNQRKLDRRCVYVQFESTKIIWFTSGSHTVYRIVYHVRSIGRAWDSIVKRYTWFPENSDLGGHLFPVTFWVDPCCFPNPNVIHQQPTLPQVSHEEEKCVLENSASYVEQIICCCRCGKGRVVVRQNQPIYFENMSPPPTEMARALQDSCQRLYYWDSMSPLANAHPRPPLFTNTGYAFSCAIMVFQVGAQLCLRCGPFVRMRHEIHLELAGGKIIFTHPV